MSAALSASELASSPARHSLAAAHGSASGRTHLDLFSGIGGFALAAKWAGWSTIGFAETDTYASNILKRHWPDVPNSGDVRNVRGVRADLITGGFPCQPFSCVGKRTGKDDDRYLWPEMRRIISESRAAWVCGENVPELDGVALGDVLADMESLGYQVQTLEIPACGVGAPHKRRRLWIVAHRQGDRLQDATRQDGQPCACGGASCGVDTLRSRELLADSDREQMERSAIEHNPWATEPGVGRVAHGIPNRVDRLRGLGNAIVPQVATVILAAMARMQNDKDQRRAETPRRTEKQ
jgi:DNA (cytosine-5)-methyltransferase 1